MTVIWSQERQPDPGRCERCGDPHAPRERCGGRWLCAECAHLARLWAGNRQAALREERAQRGEVVIK